MEVNIPQFVILNYEIKSHKAVLFYGGKNNFHSSVMHIK